MPQSRSIKRRKARTAYELLQQVCAHIKAEPRGYLQCVWGVTGDEAKDMAHADGHTVPPCGTMACRAGWIVALHDGGPSFKRRILQASFSIRDRANMILGMDSGSTFSLFDEFAISQYRNTDLRSYAAEGVRGLRTFMAEHRTHLKSRMLKGV